MKKEITQRTLLILFMAAVFAYTVYNFVSGGITNVEFLVIAAILGYPLVANIARLISDLRNS